MFNFLKKVFKKSLNKKILIIEDNEILADMYKTKLENEGFDVKSIIIEQESDKDLVDIVDYLKQENPDLILLDLMMPKISGYDILGRLNVEGLHYKIIVFSNLTDTNDKDKSMELGAIDFVIKSNITPKELVEKIKKVI